MNTNTRRRRKKMSTLKRWNASAFEQRSKPPKNVSRPNYASNKSSRKLVKIFAHFRKSTDSA